MPRPRKRRCVKRRPKQKMFGPKGHKTQEKIIFKIEEYESIRLMDYEGLTQEECAKQMNIGRTTFQRIYKSAREKIAKSFVEHKNLVLSDDENNIIYHEDKPSGGEYGRNKCQKYK